MHSQKNILRHLAIYLLFDVLIQKYSGGRENMEWLPVAVIAILIVTLGLYFIVKWAVKDALKEYFRDKNDEE